MEVNPSSLYKAIQDSTIDAGHWKDELEFYQYEYGLCAVEFKMNGCAVSSKEIEKLQEMPQ